MRKILAIGFGLTIAFGLVGCAVVPIDAGYYEPPVTVVAPTPRYYVAPPPRYYVFPARPYHGHRHWDDDRRW